MSNKRSKIKISPGEQASNPPYFATCSAHEYVLALQQSIQSHFALPPALGKKLKETLDRMLDEAWEQDDDLLWTWQEIIWKSYNSSPNIGKCKNHQKQSRINHQN